MGRATTRQALRGAALTALLTAVACRDHERAAPDADVDAFIYPYVEIARAPTTINPDLDLLWVIDDSPGMLELQANLKSAFPAFLNTLGGMEGGLPSLHLGVVSSDLGTRGTMDAQPGPSVGSGPGSCAGYGKGALLQTNASKLLTGAFILDLRDGRSRTANYTGPLADVFSELASLGEAGCEYEQPLEAAKRALFEPNNAGFVRYTARLGIIVVSNEDDCSFEHSTLLGNDTATLGPPGSFRCTRLGVTCWEGGRTPAMMDQPGDKSECGPTDFSQYVEPVGNFVFFFRSIKSELAGVFAAAVAGPPSPVKVAMRIPQGGTAAIPALVPTCPGTPGSDTVVADPAVRLAYFANGYQGDGAFVSACSSDLSPQLSDVARQLRLVIGDSCLNRELPETPGACKVIDDEGGIGGMSLPPCPDSPICYRFVVDPATCAGGSHMRVVVERASPPPPETVVSVHCRY